jgi:hypothetical protein
MNIYLDLTQQFNSGRLRTIISSGQAVVLHRLAVMSKDGDWILRENDEALLHVLSVLESHGAVYRFGAPLDLRWLRGGWSSHFEFQQGVLRVRTDFVTRPARVSADDLARIWREQEGRQPPCVGLRDLVAIKKTNREKDFAVIGELARLLPDETDQMLESRSALDLIELARRRPDLVEGLANKRLVLRHLREGRDALEVALDAEKRMLMHANERRLRAYMAAADAWAARWPTVQRRIAGLPLRQAHPAVVAEAATLLPCTVEAHQP